ncbi:hypothetical protein OQA88_5232 [Cercophora sp. LCS_1]
MAPSHGLVHLKEYDIKDSNVELIGTDIDHKVKYNSATTEPAWNDGAVGLSPGLFIWRIENFAVVPIPKESYGHFFEGDSYIILHTEEIKSQQGDDKLIHDIFFWLGAHTSQDEAGTAAYKTVELDEFLHGAATQHRELQGSPSDAFLGLFPRLTVRRGGVASGFRRVEEPVQPEITTLLRVFKRSADGGGRDTVVVHEVEPTWRSLDEEDVFILDKGDKIFVWQGKRCSPMEKAKAAQVVHDMTLAKHVEVEVISQTESRSYRFVKELGGGENDGEEALHAARPMRSFGAEAEEALRPRRLFRLSDASGQLTFELVGERRLASEDVFLFDDGKQIWVWEGKGASKAEKAMWLRVAQAYVRHLQSEDDELQAYMLPIAKVREESETAAFWRAINAA